MTQQIVKQEEIAFLLKCVREVTIGSNGGVGVSLVLPVGFDPEFDKMKELFEYFIQEAHINCSHQVFYSVRGTVKNEELKAIFTKHLMNDRQRSHS